MANDLVSVVIPVFNLELTKGVLKKSKSGGTNTVDGGADTDKCVNDSGSDIITNCES